MANTGYTEEDVLKVLKDGGQLWYFYLDGGVAIHSRNGAPIPGCYCPIQIFLALREKGAITPTEKKNTGYPYYADNAKFFINDSTKIYYISEY